MTDPASNAEPAGDGPYSLDQIIDLLTPSASASTTSHSAAVMLESYSAQREVVNWLVGLAARGEEGPDTPQQRPPLRLSELDAVLLRWLHAAYLHAASLPGLGRGERSPLAPLAGLVAGAGLLAPFITVEPATEPSGEDVSDSPQTGQLVVGLPTNEDATADELSELMRIAGAALVTYNDYLTKPARTGGVPSDESSLLFTSIAIRSCQSAEALDKFARQAEALRRAHPTLGPAVAAAAASAAASDAAAAAAAATSDAGAATAGAEATAAAAAADGTDHTAGAEATAAAAAADGTDHTTSSAAAAEAAPAAEPSTTPETATPATTATSPEAPPAAGTAAVDLAPSETSASSEQGAAAAATPAAASAAGQQQPPVFARQASFGACEVRWLMHWVRAQLSEHFAAVCYLTGDQEGHKNSLVSAQQDKLCLLKLEPASLVAYILYCRACLQFQQVKAARIFSGKGLIVAAALNDDALKAPLLLIHATALALGGDGGPTFSGREVQEARAGALAARDASVAWLPRPFHALLDELLQPELGIVSDKILAPHGLLTPAAESSTQQQGTGQGKEGGEQGEGEGEDRALPVLQAMYAVPEPDFLPPGAVERDGEEEGEEGEEAEGGEGQGSGTGSPAAAPAAAAAGQKKGGGGGRVAAATVASPQQGAKAAGGGGGATAARPAARTKAQARRR